MDFPELSNCLLIQSRFPLSSPRDMSTAGEEFLDCSCLFSWFLKSLDNRFNCIDEEDRGKIGASIRTFFSFLLMLLRFNHKCLSVATRCCHSPERQICGPVQFANRSGYYRNFGSLRAGTRHHGEFLRYGNSFPPTFPEDLLAHASPNDWPIVAKHANTSSRGSINARDNYVRIWYWMPLGWTSSDHGDHRDVSFPLSGNRGYDSNRSVPFRAFTRHHREFLRYGFTINQFLRMLFNPAVREATGSLYQLHSEVEFPSITALVGWAHSW